VNGWPLGCKTLLCCDLNPKAFVRNVAGEFRTFVSFGSRARMTCESACKRWDSRGPTRGVLQIAPGMGEHSGRYCELIDALQRAEPW